MYANNSSYVYNLALRMAGNPADADDVYQDAFLRVHRFLPQFRGTGLKSWLRRITVNVFCTHYRKREKEQPEEHVGENLVDAPGETLAENLSAALERLGPEMRAVMILREVEELSYQEIAELLSVPVGTVRSRISRARLQLLSYIQPS